MPLDFAVNGYKFKNYWCRVVIDESRNFNDKEHSHSFFELHLCFKGESVFIIDGQRYTLCEGKYILLPRRKKHTVISMTEDFEKFVWGFDIKAETKEDIKFNSAIKNYYFGYDESVSELLSLIFSDVKNRSYMYSETVKCKLFLLYTELFRQVTKMTDRVVDTAEKNRWEKRINAYIDDNLIHGVTIDDVCKEFAICERQLYRISLDSFGVSIGKYIAIKKSEKAKTILAETDSSLSEIASVLGYSDAYTFGKAFKRLEGMSPGEFRKSIKK